MDEIVIAEAVKVSPAVSIIEHASQNNDNKDFMQQGIYPRPKSNQSVERGRKKSRSVSRDKKNTT